MRMPRWMMLFGLFAVLAASPAFAQDEPDDDDPDAEEADEGAGGVYIDPDGVVRQREYDRGEQLQAMRERARAAARHRHRDPSLAFVSLPAATAEARRLFEAGKALPDELRYLGGITRIQYVLVYPEDGDLVIGGPAEPIAAGNTLQPVGKLTGRPVLHLEDLVVALRSIDADRGRALSFGCTINAPRDAVANTNKVVGKHGSINSRAERYRLFNDVLDAIGPHKVEVFGIEPHTRVAWVCVTADYKMKRLSFGVDPEPVRGLGDSLGPGRSGGNRFWFEASFEPLRVSPDGLAYELRGQRLVLKATYGYDDRPATRSAQAWANRVNREMEQIADAMPLFADLQNMADMLILASLIRTDKLDQKVDWDTTWLADQNKFPVRKVTVPRTAQTILVDRKRSFVTGGVVFSAASVVAPRQRERALIELPTVDEANVATGAAWLREPASPGASGESSPPTE